MIYSLPASVQRYLDGGIGDLDVASWALENNEVEVFKQIHTEGFCFSLSQRQRHEEKQSMGRTLPAKTAWPEIEYSSNKEIDSDNVHGLILLLRMPANFSRLKLNLSSIIDEQLLTELLDTIDTLPDIRELELEIDGRCDGRIHPKLCLAFAGSEACLSTPTVRSWIIQNLTHAIGNPENIEERFQVDVQIELGRVQSTSEVKLHPEHLRRIAAVCRLNTSALQAAPAAVAAFLANKGCPGTGRPIMDTHADALARIALYYREPALQLAISKLAPHRKIVLLKLPEPSQIKHLQLCDVPCEFQFQLTPQDVTPLSIRLAQGASLFTDLTLTVVENLGPVHLQKLYQSICNLPKLDHLSFSINPEVTLDVGNIVVDSKDHEVELLILNGADKAKSSATAHLKFLNLILNPRILSVHAGTPGAAASIIENLVSEVRQGARLKLKELDIHCALPSIPQEPSLVYAIGNLLKETSNGLIKIVVRTPQPLITDEDEKTNFIQLVHRYGVQEDIRFDYFSSLSNQWRTDLYIECRPKLSEVAGVFFSNHLRLPASQDGLSRAFPSNIGNHAAEIALSPNDLRTLALVSPATAEAARRGSAKHIASVIVFELKHGGHDVLSLREGLSPHGELDQALVSEVRTQLGTRALPDGVLAMLNEVAPLKNA